jgi:hypothetical protein
MHRTTFHPSKFESNIVQPYFRSEDGKLAPTPLPVPTEPPKETAGHGVWGTVSDYIRLLSAILDDGNPILGRQSVDEIIAFQMPDPKAVTETIHGPFKPVLGPSIPLDQEVQHGLAGLINMRDFPGRRKSGTLQWSGMPNLIWVGGRLSLPCHIAWHRDLHNYTIVDRPQNGHRCHYVFANYVTWRPTSWVFQRKVRGGWLSTDLSVTTNEWKLVTRFSGFHYKYYDLWLQARIVSTQYFLPNATVDDIA